MDDVKSLIFKACLALDRHGVETYEKAEISAFERSSGVLYIKPHGMDGDEEDILQIEINSISGDIPYRESVMLHAELYSRFHEISSVARVNSEWISIYACAGRKLDKSAYGYIPNFDTPIPCTAKIAVDGQGADLPKLIADAIETALAESKLSSPRTVLLRGMGALLFGEAPTQVAEDAITVEYAAKKAFYIRKIR